VFNLCCNVVVTFRFRQPMYMFMEDVGTGTVCVDKIGDSDRTITVTVSGGEYKINTISFDSY
jgi:hypothetical protein